MSDRDQLYAELTGPLRTVGETAGGLPAAEQGAPAWWHGEDEAYAAVAARLGLPR